MKFNVFEFCCHYCLEGTLKKKKSIVAYKTYGNVKLSPLRLVWDLCIVRLSAACVIESHHYM